MCYGEGAGNPADRRWVVHGLCTSRISMHARELLELALLAATHAPALIEGNRRIPERCVERYWIFSKVRLDRWAWTLKGDIKFGRLVRGTIEEIFAGEVLARVWMAVLAAYDRRRCTDEAEPVARSVVGGHVEARHRALQILVDDSRIDARAIVELNRLLRHADRLTELLVEQVEFPDSLSAQHAAGLFQSGFRTPLAAGSPNPDLNARIAAGVVGCFPDEVFQRSDWPFPLWFAHVMSTAEEAQSMIDELAVGECW